MTSPILLERGCPEKWPEVPKIGDQLLPQEHPAGQNNNYPSPGDHEETDPEEETLASHENPVSTDIIGPPRDNYDTIIVDARSRYHCSSDGLQKRCLENIGLMFPEAGPRKEHVYPIKNTRVAVDSLKVGILVSGGIAPGINAVIKGIVDRHILYNRWAEESKTATTYNLEIRGFREWMARALSA